MASKSESIYPGCPTILRNVEVGGVTKSALAQALAQNAISLNEYAERLLASDLFTTSETRYALTTVELAVRNLGFPRGATTPELHERAGELGLGLRPPELGPHLRLQYRDQPEGFVGMPIRQHRAPCGSITIASEPLADDNDSPKGLLSEADRGRALAARLLL